MLPLRADIKDLSAVVVEVLLGSEALQLRSENDVYYLLCAWRHTPRAFLTMRNAKVSLGGCFRNSAFNTCRKIFCTQS